MADDVRLRLYKANERQKSYGRNSVRGRAAFHQVAGNRLTSAQLSRIKTLMEKAFQNCTEKENVILKRCYSRSMILGIDALRHELEEAKIEQLERLNKQLKRDIEKVRNET